MSRLLHRLRGFSGELRRRKVVRVLIAYLVASAAIVGVAADVAPALEFPESAVRLVVLLLVAGLPVALCLAWVYDVVPDHGAGGAEATAGAAAADRPAARTGTAPRDSLPAQTTPFIGREQELTEVGQLLAEPATRLVTILGPGGVGKTRLAVRAAEAARGSFPDGVVFVPLAGLPSGELLASTLAEALGMPISRRAEPLAELIDFLRAKRMLLVLDNMEHLVAAASQVAAIEEAAPDVVLITTSRERLCIPGEAVVHVEGMRLVGPDGQDGEAIRLFVAAARRQDGRYTLDAATRPCVRRLCELLGGNALAIELAAAWTRVLSCAEIVSEVQRDLDILGGEAGGRPDRHRSLGATFEASWRLLSPEERTALRRVAVFVGPFDRAAASVVAQVDLPLLRMLVDKSLLTRAGGRFHLLNVLRQYALKRLADEPADATSTQQRHTAWFCGLLRTLEPGLRRSEPDALRDVAENIADIRAAWSAASEHRDVDSLLLAADGLFLFCDARGWAREGAEAFERAGDALTGPATPDLERRFRSARGRLLVRRGALLERLGSVHEAEELLRRGLDIATELNDDAEVALALDRLGTNRWSAGAYDEAAALHRRARDICERLGDRLGIGWSLAHLGNVALARGEHDLAGRLYTDALLILSEEHDRNGMCVVLNNLGYIAIRREQYGEARMRMSEALALQAGLGNQRSAAYLLNNLGFAAREAGDYDEAAQHLREALEISERLGYQGIAASSLTGLAELHVRTGELDLAPPLLQRALGIAANVGDHRVALETLLTLARLRAARGNTGGAARLARFVASHPAVSADTRQESEALLDRLGLPVQQPPVAGDDVEAEIADAIADELAGAGAPADAPARQA